MSITVGSASGDHGNYFKVSVDGHPINAPGERGIGLVVVEKGTRKVLFSRIFDTHLDPNECVKLHSIIQDVKPGNFIVIGVKDEGSRSLSLDLIQSITLLGSKYIQSLTPLDSWAFIVRKGKPHSAQEAKDSNTAVELTLAKKPHLHYVEITSAAFHHGNSFTVTINENPNNTITYSNSQRGIVLIVLDKEGKVRMNQIFDTHESIEACDQLESNIQSFASQYPGNLIILGVKDEGSQSLTTSLRRVISSLGSQYITQLGFGESWCFISRLGNTKSALEKKDPGQSVTLSWVPKKKRLFNPQSYSIQYNPPGIDPSKNIEHLVDPPIVSVHHHGSIGPGVGIGTNVRNFRARRRETMG